MKYTKYEKIVYTNVKSVTWEKYIISKNDTCESESDAEWKEDVGIPTSELEIDATMDYLKKVKNFSFLYIFITLCISLQKKKFSLISIKPILDSFSRNSLIFFTIKNLF